MKITAKEARTLLRKVIFLAVGYLLLTKPNDDK